VGMSNGGYFAHLVGKERSGTVAAVASHSGPLGLQALAGVNARRKFPVLIVHGDQDRLLPVDWARENRDKYRKEGHGVTYVELPGPGRAWATQAGVNEPIWEFFAGPPRARECPGHPPKSLRRGSPSARRYGLPARSRTSAAGSRPSRQKSVAARSP